MKLSKLLVILSLTLSIFASLCANAAPKIVDKIAAVVNSNVILESDVQDMMKNIKASTESKNLPNDKKLRKQIIDRLVGEDLMLQLADKIKLSVSDEQVNSAIENIAAQNNMDILQLREKLSTMGISYDSYLARIKKDMLLEQVRLNAVRQRITISDKAVDNLSKKLALRQPDNTEVNLSHILLVIPEEAAEKEVKAATDQAKEIIALLQKGESFAKLAATYSNDENALNGGEMGWNNVHELPTIFEERLVRTRKGAIVGPIRSSVGLHILKVNDTRSIQEEPITITEVNARHILIKTSEFLNDVQAKQKLLKIRKDLIKKKITFKAAAKTYSEDQGSATKGGNLGWSEPDRYDSEFKTALMNLKKGAISQPIKSQFGWHLIQLINTRSVNKNDIERRQEAYRLLFNKKFSEELPVWIQELKNDAYINVIDDKK